MDSYLIWNTNCGNAAGTASSAGVPTNDAVHARGDEKSIFSHVVAPILHSFSSHARFEHFVLGLREFQFDLLLLPKKT